MRDSLFRLLVVVITFGFIAISMGFWSLTTNVSGKNRMLLFSLKDTPKAMKEDEKNSIASVRESEINISNESLSAVSLEKLNLPLFDGKTYEVIRNKSEGLEKRSNDNFTWRGKLVDGKFSGDVILTFHKGYITGLIYSQNAVYEIVTKGDKQILIELDQSLFPECGGEIKAPENKEAIEPQNIGAVEDSGDRIDVLVVFTEAVKNAVGGEAQAQTLAQNAVDSANSAYINSKVRQRLKLVHSELTDLTESNSLSNLRDNAEVQELRNRHNADMVAMLVNSLGGCGVGYLMTSVGSGFSGSAYSITRRSCAVGNLTFAHELGHNMGSAHNPENAGNAAFPYSYGHYLNGSYRTVLSYSSPCGSGCTRVPQFSNPAVVFNGQPTGLLDTRNNSRSLENTSDTVSNFRYSGTSLRLNNFSEKSFIPRNITRTVNWTSDNLNGNVKIELSRNEGTTWETLIASTPNDGSQEIMVGGRPTKRVRIRISGLNNTEISDSSIENLSIK